MKRHLVLGLGLGMLLMLGACGGGGSGGGSASENGQGEVAFKVDLGALQQKDVQASAQPATATAITAVSVILSRTGFDSITSDLTVAGTTASGTIHSLAAGYWHVVADVYSGATNIFTGETDVQIVAGATVQAQILFDPVVTEPTDGSLTLTVGLNPMPGYRVINQQITKIFPDEAGGKLYILDSSTGIIAVYDGATMVRERDIVLESVPLAAALSASRSSFFLAYTGGKVYRLDIASGAMSLVGDILAEANRMVAVNETFLLVATGTGWSSSNSMKVLNTVTGQVVASNNYWYPMADLVLNPGNGIAYGHDTGLSPQDVHRIAVDGSTGALTIRDSRYHGDYSLGTPLRIINSGGRLAAAWGSTFFSSSNAAEDIVYGGNLGYGYVDLASDDLLALLYLLNSSGTKKLLVLDQENFFVRQTVDLLGDPKWVFHTVDCIIVITRDQATMGYYAKVFSKAALGLK